MNKKKVGIAGSAVAVAALIAVGGGSVALAATSGAPSATSGYAAPGERGQGGPGGGHSHTEVTGDEATKVSDAVTAKDSAVTVESVRKDADGSYDVLGTKDGAKVMVEVSADLKTIEVRTGGPGGKGGRGGGGGTHTEVTGDEATKVTDAVTAKDSALTVESVRKDADGSYDVLGTKDGAKVMVEVSADLKTIEVRTGGPGGHGRGGDGAGEAPSESGTAAPAPTQTS